MGYCQIFSDISDPSNISDLSDIFGYCQILSDIVRYRQISSDIVRYCRICRGWLPVASAAGGRGGGGEAGLLQQEHLQIRGPQGGSRPR
mgnify:CR=1 FL=1